MTHQEAEQHEVVERYVRDRLTPEERRAFQEHFFACDECFEQVQMAEKFIAGVRYAAETGLLAPLPEARPSRPIVPLWVGWLKPAFALTALVAAALAAALGWLALYQMPRLRQEAASERQQREQLARQSQESLSRAEEQLQRAEEQRKELENQLAAARQNAPPPTVGVEANIPLVILDSARDGQRPDEMRLSARAKNVLFWVSVDPNAPFSSYRLDIYADGNQLIQRVDGLRKNAHDALSVSLPAQLFRSGKYRAKLYGVTDRQTTLVGEYSLTIWKK